jgi:hypothetical protein
MNLYTINSMHKVEMNFVEYSTSLETEEPG